ncbi:MAG: hypothetical protein QOE67_1008 [Solirubrobacteraceae bacterium]|jgi:uncharacterized membrane protein|nr:hypothetical protein [Solirubrobacteraceae bacterium]
MSGVELTLVASVFLASAVEAVEALTVVLAVGTTRSWRSSLLGVAAAVLALGALVSVFGLALTEVPIDVLRTFVGAFLLLFGLQWLRKAILRAAGLLAIHDEDLAYRRERESARAAGTTAGDIDRYALAVSFKAVLLEGLEVALIVITFGASQRRVGLAALAAGASILVVAGLGFALRAPLARVPENALKLTVGVLLTAFGTFWAAEGVGAQWPGGEGALPVLIGLVLAFALLIAAGLRRRAGDRTARGGPAAAPLGRVGTALSFFVGDDWLVAGGVAVALALTALLATLSPAWYPMPVAMIALMWFSVVRRTQPAGR